MGTETDFSKWWKAVARNQNIALKKRNNRMHKK